MRWINAAKRYVVHAMRLKNGTRRSERKLQVLMLGLRGFPNVEGGVETHAENLCVKLAEIGCDVVVIVRSPYQRTDTGQVWRDIRFVSLWAPRIRGAEALIHTFLGVLYAAVMRPDILHIQAIGPSMMTPLARLLGLRVVVTHHGADYDRQKWGNAAKAVLRTGERLGMQFSNARISISQAIRQIVKDKYGLDSSLIPNGVNLPVIPHTTEILESFDLSPMRYALLVGRFVPEKRHHDLIQAFSQAELEGWKLVLVGSTHNPDEYTKSVLRAAESNPNIVCTGFQTGTALKELYAHASVFVLPSSHEGLPIVLLEALSFGLPVIASDIPAHMGADCEGISYFACGNIRALINRLRRRADEVEDRMHKERLRQHILEKYKWSDVARQTYDTYSAVMAADALAAMKRQNFRVDVR